ncbi:MAG TPA: aminodeoxychorismate/anthranilate synthase component II [Flavobacteriales bacterium]|nr:aminodeoxychorismate/anthranilate synthase component II [Flavobacteriales bacterium]HRP81794.1 aminodeoxychorismate/anthranilate synthase component II [Flavobacteriales bacterium]
MRILLLDNYDSFTWNLFHLLAPMAEVDVVRNDAITVEKAAQYDRIVLSPGPGLPSEAGVMPRLVNALLPTHPILGVCLGLQAIVEECGGKLYNLSAVRHGVALPCIPELPEDPLFHGLGASFPVGLYHSWAADPARLPTDLRVIARSGEGTVMAVRHATFPAWAVQFHPESVLTPQGPRIIRNWLEHCPAH